MTVWEMRVVLLGCLALISLAAAPTASAHLRSGTVAVDYRASISRAEHLRVRGPDLSERPGAEHVDQARAHGDRARLSGRADVPVGSDRSVGQRCVADLGGRGSDDKAPASSRHEPSLAASASPPLGELARRPGASASVRRQRGNLGSPAARRRPPGPPQRHAASVADARAVAMADRPGRHARGRGAVPAHARTRRRSPGCGVACSHRCRGVRGDRGGVLARRVRVSGHMDLELRRALLHRDRYLGIAARTAALAWPRRDRRRLTGDGGWDQQGCDLLSPDRARCAASDCGAAGRDRCGGRWSGRLGRRWSVV